MWTNTYYIINENNLSSGKNPILIILDKKSNSKHFKNASW